MFPLFSKSDVRYGRLGDSVLLGDGALRDIARVAKSANLNNLGLSQFLGAAVHVRSSFLPILSVHLLRPLIEMGRIATGCPVASVADVQRRPVTICPEEGQSMGRVCASIIPRPEAGTSVPVSGSCFGPCPAFAFRALAGGLIYVTPKTFNLLRGKLRRVYSNFNHDVTSGIGCFVVRLNSALTRWVGPSAFYHTEVF